jgi:hypothetical protein
MRLVQFLLPLLSALLLASPTSSRLDRRVSHPAIKGEHLSTNVILGKRKKYDFFLPGQSWDGIATSYDWRTDGVDGGACGYTLGEGPAIPSTILGAAQQLRYFGNGLSCGTCVKIHPTDYSPAKDAEPQIVTSEWSVSGAAIEVVTEAASLFSSYTVLNSCPGSCHSIDIESEVVTNWFHTRLGQFNCESLSRRPFFILTLMPIPLSFSPRRSSALRLPSTRNLHPVATIDRLHIRLPC